MSYIVDAFEENAIQSAISLEFHLSYEQIIYYSDYLASGLTSHLCDYR